jgi:pimeloyl-ACP methyl ester carboxylesterase
MVPCRLVITADKTAEVCDVALSVASYCAAAASACWSLRSCFSILVLIIVYAITHTNSKLTPVKGCSKITCPALFIAARGDKMVPPHHGHILADAYAGPHHIIDCTGECSHSTQHVTLESNCCVTVMLLLKCCHEILAFEDVQAKFIHAI